MAEEAKLGDDRTYFGFELGASYTTATAFASSYGGPGTYFAVARVRNSDGSPGKLGYGFVVNGTIGRGLVYSLPADDARCGTPCVDGAGKKCGDGGDSKDPLRPLATWAVYGPAGAQLPRQALLRLRHTLLTGCMCVTSGRGQSDIDNSNPATSWLWAQAQVRGIMVSARCCTE